MKNFLEVRLFLSGINKKFFGGKAKFKPLDWWNSWGVNHKKTSIISGMELYIEKNKMKFKKTHAFHSLGIEIIQSENVANNIYSVEVRGTLRFKAGRENNGNWHGEPVFFNRMTNGRSITFPCGSIPPKEEISETVIANIKELLIELSLNDLMPELPKEKKMKPEVN